MSFPKIVRQTPVKHGDEWTLTVSTVQIARNYYDTVIFDDSADKRHNGMVLAGHEHEGRKYGPYVIDKSSTRAATREEAMEHHREALYAARTETPKAPQALLEPRACDWDETPAEAARYDRIHWERDED